MKRAFSIRRRRPHIVDLYTPVVAGVTGYRLKWAPNFTGPWTTILTSSNVGFLDPNISRNAIETQPTHGRDVRIVFDPESFSIPDATSFWLQFVPVTGSAEGTPSAPTLVLPDSLRRGDGIAVVHGAAPSGTPLQLDLPMLAKDVRVHNESGSTSLLVSTEAGGAAMAVVANDSYHFSTYGPIGTLYVAGNGAAVNFSVSFSLGPSA